VADHLVELGHRHVAFAGGPQHSLDSKHRLRGLTEGLARHGIRLDKKSDFLLRQLRGERRRRLRRDVPRPSLFEATALVMGNDALALGFMRVAQQRGVRVPRHLSIVGFDDVAGRRADVAGPDDRRAADAARWARAACRRLFEATRRRACSRRSSIPSRSWSARVQGRRGPRK